MQLGVIDLRHTGAHIVRRLLAAGHQCVVYDEFGRLVAELAAEKAYGAASLPDLAHELDPPRVIWMAGTGADVDRTIAQLLHHVDAGDIIADGSGASDDNARRAAALATAGIAYVDVAISGPLARLDEPCCVTVGGDLAAARYLEPVFVHVAAGGARPAPGADAGGSGTLGYVHCGPAGAGHFVAMVHDEIGAALLAAYASGLTRLGEGDPRAGLCSLNLREIADAWRHGSLVASHLLDLTARALAKDVAGANFSTRLLAAVQQECGAELQHSAR